MLQMTLETLQRTQAQALDELVALARPILAHREALYQRYARKSSPGETMHGSIRDGRERAIVAFEYYIVNMVQGYLGGKSPMYRVSTPAIRDDGDETRQYVRDYAAAIETIRRYNDDGATFIELIHDYLITAAAHLYLYQTEEQEIVYTRFDSRNTVAIFDYGIPPSQIGAIRLWQEDDDGDPVEMVEIITPDQRSVYADRGGYQLVETEPLLWGDVPCVAFENPDGMAVFEPALSAIDTYEQLVSNVRDMTQYNDEAKLMLEGYASDTRPGTPERAREEAAILQSRLIYVGERGNVKWLLKDVNYDGVLAIQSNLHDLITMLTGVPNLTDEAFSNADNASALGYKLYALDQYSATTDRVFKKGYQRLWELITSRINTLRSTAFDFRDIDIVMQRNIPTDRDKSIARAAQMKQSGLFSEETCINESQIEVSAHEEIQRRQTEQDNVPLVQANPEENRKTEAAPENEEALPDQAGEDV